MKNPAPRPLLERDIKRQIVQWLQLQGCFCWVNHSTGIFDPTQGRFRKLNGFGQIRGTADLLGIWQGKPLAIEVKTSTGRLSQYQAIFLHKFQAAGGIALVARSVEDVANALKSK